MTQQYDPEIQEWLSALRAVTEFNGTDQAQAILTALSERAAELGLSAQTLHTPYLNTISAELQAKMPDDGSLMAKLEAYIRWNAICMVMRAGKKHPELGGHIGTYGSTGSLYEVALTYFIRGPEHPGGGDLVYFQGHATPGNYARAYLEGRLTEKNLDAFRQEESQKSGLSSYPHPWLMPNFWQFPTVSMGLGMLMAIYQAYFLKYLHNRGLANTADRRVWIFCGDGELNEPESLGAINIAGREKLDNLLVVVSCNLQRLDGPVFGNGKIIQEYEGVFRGAGWNVIKAIWGSGWDTLFEKDKTGLLKKRISELVDGESQNYSSKDGAYFREHFFGKYPELLALVSDMSDADLKNTLLPAGHDHQKLFAAYAKAVSYPIQPTVVLAQTIKGFGMGGSGEGKNIAHNSKKITLENLLAFRDRFHLPLSNEQVEHLEYMKPDKNSAEMQYLFAQRKALGGFVPTRNTKSPKLKVPALSELKPLLESSGDREISTTMAFVRALGTFLKDPNIGKYIVPIVPDESRTFGMEGLFRQIGIYSSYGQTYTPEDKSQLSYYREAKDGQFMQGGISEAGCMATWIAAATSYSTNALPMIPFFTYYSMFGYQRFGDLVWAAGDMRARGFIVGGTAGKTTLAGEGLQHDDGHNLLLYSVVPNCVTYDPAFSYEIAVILQDGLRRMYDDQEDIFYYITAMNENYLHPAMPKGVEEGILKGLYLFKHTLPKAKVRVQLIGGGAILNEVIRAAEYLEKEHKIGADVWSATSFNELFRDARAVNRHNRLHPAEKPKESYIKKALKKAAGPVIAATDYVKLYAEQVRSEIEQPYYVLGTDGFGRSDTREALREYFEVNAHSIAYTALFALTEEKKFTKEKLKTVLKQLKIKVDAVDPGNK